MTRDEDRLDGEQATAGDAAPAAGWLAVLDRNRAFSALFAVSILAGALAGVFYLPDDFSLLRRVFGGAIAGGGIAFLMTATKML